MNHYRNHEGQIDQSNGRIYRLKTKGAKPGERFDLRRTSTRDLLGLLKNSNRWFRQTALQLIADRPDRGSLVPALERQLAEQTGPLALESLWALNLCGGLSEARALGLLRHPNPQVRMWTARLLADEGTVSAPIATELRRLAAVETSVEVRAQLACSSRRLPAKEGLSIVRALLEHDEDATDPRQPLLLWWSIESKAESDRDAVLALFGESPLWQRPLVADHLLGRIMRRYAQSGGAKNYHAAAQLFELSPSESLSKRLTVGFEEAFKGRSMAGLPPELTKALARHNSGSVSVGLRQHDPKAIASALKSLADPQTREATRLEYLDILSEMKIAEAPPILLQVVSSSSDKQLALRRSALAALQPYDDPSIAEQVASLHAKMDYDSQAAAQNLLASRPAWALKLLQGVEAGKVARDSVQPAVLRRIRGQKDPAVSALAEKIWGRAGSPTTAEMEQRIRKLSSAVRDGTGDPYTGRELFQKTCASCHRLFGGGGEVGPDLTTYKRDDIDVMMLNIVNPSAEVREGFENYQIETRDDRSLNGFLVEQDARVVVLRGIDGRIQRLERTEIAEMKASKLSLMPEGLLDPLNEQQVRDLFAYLRSTQPLVGERPKR